MLGDVEAVALVTEVELAVPLATGVIAVWLGVDEK
jgi:hypothetical protein